MPQPFSLIGPMSTQPYAIGERPGGSYIPLIPLMSGKEAWDSIAGRYDTRHGDSILNGITTLGARPHDNALDKKAAPRLRAPLKPLNVGGRVPPNQIGLDSWADDVVKALQSGAKTPPAVTLARPGAKPQIPGIGSPAMDKAIEDLMGKAYNNPWARAGAGTAAGVGGLMAASHLMPPGKKPLPPMMEAGPEAAAPPSPAASPAAPSPEPAPQPLPDMEAARIQDAATEGSLDPASLDPRQQGELNQITGKQPGMLEGLGNSIAGMGQQGASALGLGDQFKGLPQWAQIAAPLGVLGGGAIGAKALYDMFNRRDPEEEEKLAWVKRAAARPATFSRECPLLTGFLAACGRADLTDDEINEQLKTAAALHPGLRDELVKVGAITPPPTPLRPPPPGGVALPKPAPQPAAAPGGAAPGPFNQPPAPPAPTLNRQQGYWDAPQLPQSLYGALDARQQGLLPQDIERGRVPALRQGMTPEQQAAYGDYSKQFDAYMGNRKLWEQEWAGQGEAGAKAYHQAYRDFAGKGRPPGATPQPSGPAAPWNRDEAWRTAFGKMPEDWVAGVASGKIGPDQLQDMLAQDPSFVSRLQDQYAAFQHMDRGLGQFGAGADATNAANIPGATLYAQSRAGGVKGMHDPKMQETWSLTQGNPIRRLQATVDIANRNKYRMTNDEAQAARQFDPQTLYDEYIAQGLQHEDAKHRAVSDVQGAYEGQSPLGVLATTALSGAPKTLGAMKAAPFAAAHSLATGDSRPLQGWARDLASIAADPLESATGLRLGDHSYFKDLHRQGAELAENSKGKGLPQELLGRTAGTAMHFAPTAFQAAGLGGLGQGGVAGRLGAAGLFNKGMGYVGGMSKLPGYAALGEAVQTGLDNTPLPGGGTVGDYQQAAGDVVGENFGNMAGAAVREAPSAAAMMLGGGGLKMLGGGLGKAPIHGVGSMLSNFGKASPAMAAGNTMLNGGPQSAAPGAGAADLQRRLGRPLSGFEQTMFGEAPKTTSETQAGTVPPPEPTNPNLGTATPDGVAGVSGPASQFVNQDTLAQLEPGVRNTVTNAITNTQKFFSDPKQQQLGQQALKDLGADKVTAAAKTALGNLHDQTGWSWQQTQEAYNKMDTGQQFLLWSGLGVGAISVLSNLMSEEGGGIMGWLMALLGLGVGAGAAAHGGLLGQDAQKGMQGLMSQIDVGRRHMMGETPEQIAKAYDPEQMASTVIPMARQFGQLTPEMEAKLDQAIKHQGGIANWASGMLGGNTVEKGLAEHGFKDPQAQKNLLEGWKRYKSRAG